MAGSWRYYNALVVPSRGSGPRSRAPESRYRPRGPLTSAWPAKCKGRREGRLRGRPTVLTPNTRQPYNAWHRAADLSTEPSRELLQWHHYFDLLFRVGPRHWAELARPATASGCPRQSARHSTSNCSRYDAMKRVARLHRPRALVSCSVRCKVYHEATGPQ